MHPSLPRLTALLSLGSAALAAAAPAQRVEPTTPAPQAAVSAPASLGAAREARPARPPGPELLPGIDGTTPPLRGEIFHEAPSAEPFTGLTDEELAALPPGNFDLDVPHDALYFAPDGDDLWIRGRTYKARAGSDGFTYVPFLGSAAPQNYPLGLTLSAATLGGEALALTESAEVGPAGERIVLDRGAVEVRYDLALDSVEQSFQIELPALAGELVLALRLDTELVAEPRDAGFRFAGPHGGVDYGGAFVLDGAGRREAIETRLAGDMLELVVPAAFIETATLPVVVDPVLMTFTVDDYVADLRDPDVAYDFSSDSYLFVYEEIFSGGDTDVFSRIYTSGATYVTGQYIDSSSDSWWRPRAANLNAPDQYVVVAERRNGPGAGGSEIVSRLLGSQTHILGPVLLIGEAAPSYFNLRPDVGGSLSPSSPIAVVVWSRQFSSLHVATRYRTVDGNGNLGPIQFVDGTSGLRQTGPAISKSSGDPSTANVFNVAYRSETVSGGQVAVRGFQLNAAGAVVAGPSDIFVAAAGVDIREIDVSDASLLDGLSSPTYVITYDRYSTVEEDTYLLICRNNTNQSGTPGRELQRLEHAPIDLDQAEARIATVNDGFVVTYLDEGPGSYVVQATAFNLTEARYAAINERRTRLGETGLGYYGGAAIASRRSGGFFMSYYSGMAWSRNNGSDRNIEGATHNANLGFAQAFQYCYGNPNSTGDRGFLTMYGDRSTTGTKRLEASALPLNTFGFFICSQGFIEVNMPGTSVGLLCVGGGMIGRYSNQVQNSLMDGRFVLNIDPQQLSQPNGPVPAMAGQIWNFQAWHRDSVGGVAVSNFTNAVTMLFQ